MTIDKKFALIALVWFTIGCICGFFMGKGVYDVPLDTDIKRDTVTLWDTIPDVAPKPIDSVRTKWLVLRLPAHQPDGTAVVSAMPSGVMIQPTASADTSCGDTVEVALPITQKHYQTENYQAWVSGYAPNLDSIFIYQKETLITETITKSKPPNKWSLSVNAGIDYGTTSQFWQPYASGELTINNDKRLQLGIEGGVKKNEVTNDFEPFVGAKAKLKIF